MEKTYIALLRGINVGGQKKIKMADLKVVLDKAGLKDVKTYIQSGNIIFKSDESSKETLEEMISRIIQKNFGFVVPTMVIQGEAVKTMLLANPFSNKNLDGNLYYVLPKKPPEEELVNQFRELQFENEEYHITDSCIYLLCKTGYGKAKLNNNFIEKKLKVETTTRNQKTMQKLVEMSLV